MCDAFWETKGPPFPIKRTYWQVMFLVKPVLVSGDTGVLQKSWIERKAPPVAWRPGLKVEADWCLINPEVIQWCPKEGTRELFNVTQERLQCSNLKDTIIVLCHSTPPPEISKKSNSQAMFPCYRRFFLKERNIDFSFQLFFKKPSI